MSPHCRILLVALPLALMSGVVRHAQAEPIITEFMASNSKTLADADGSFSDWIEIYNPDAAAANLEGWYLTDNAKTKTKWKIPAVTLPAGSYLVVFASNKNRTDPTKQLHTNFALDASGGYLGLIRSDGVTVASEFAPTYPRQSDDISYGVTQPTIAGEAVKTGFFKVATPGVRNGGADALVITDAVTFSRASGPFTASVTLTLSGTTGTQRIRYVLASPSSLGATVADPGPSSTLYTGALTLSSSVIIRAAIFSADDSEHGPVTSGHFVHLATTGAARLDTFSSELPVLVIDVHGFGQMLKDDIDRPAWAYLWNRPAGGATTMSATPSIWSAATTRLHGSSSADFPKKSYDLSLKNLLGSANPQALLGEDPFESWVLSGPWRYDSTFIHNAFVYTLSNQIGRWAPRTRFVEVFVNADGGDLDTNDYVGVYVLTDKLEVDSKRIAITSLDKSDTGSTKITGGYFLKIDVPDATVFSFRTTHSVPSAPSAVYVDSPKLSGLATAQRDYIQGYIQGLDDALFSGEAKGWPNRTYADYLDRPSFVDHHILNVLASNVDAFWRSAYMTKDRSERLVAGPVWDFDRALGGGDVRTQNPAIWNGSDGAIDLWNIGWWGPLRHDPEFMQDWVDRWQQLRKTTFATATLQALVDSLAAQVGTAAAGRDLARWTADDNLQRFPTGWQGEINQMKNWLALRAAWIDSQFIAAPTVTTSGANILVTPAPGTSIAYTTDGTDPRLLGGSVAAAATVSAAPVTLPATANLHARSYVTNFNSGTNPGSPWSSVVGGPNSTATLPRPFLSNLSVLTSVADGESFTMGFIVGGSGTGGPKPLLVRAAGPSLAPFGVPSPLPDPQLAFYTGTTKTDDNNNWGGTATLNRVFEAVGAFPFLTAASKDAAVYGPAVPAGSNSVVLSGVGSTAGMVLAELYDATPSLVPSSPRLINVSVLKNLGDGLTVGFIVGPAGGPSKRVLIRVIGPTLGRAPYNVPGVVADPKLSLYAGEALLSENNDWGGTAALHEAFEATGAFALANDSRDAALVATLAPGSYTVLAKGANDTTGTALVEVYEIP